MAEIMTMLSKVGTTPVYRPAGAIPAFQLVQSSAWVRRLARVLAWSLMTCILMMAFLPWQQTSRGSGRVIAFVPQERLQTFLSPMEGIVENISDGLVEGSQVKQGDVILELEPAVANLKSQLEGQLANLKEKLARTVEKTAVYVEQIKGYEEARDSAVKAADELIKSANSELESEQELVAGYQATQRQAELNYERQVRLYRAGATSRKEVEKLEKDLQVAKSELQSALDKVESAKQQVESKKFERQEKLSSAQTKVEEAKAKKQEALGEQQATQKEISEVSVQIGELDRQVIKAPRDGTLFRMPMFERGQAVMAGDPLFTIVPDTDQAAVELWINGNDVPLVRPGDHVRLQFEGWPAIQVAGWPSVAVGTFGGEVFAVDSTDDGTGMFRIQVQPSTEEGSQNWPELRQGVRVNGWVMLRQVRLGWEIWRQLNGFPASIAEKDDGSGAKDSNGSKLKGVVK
jgi:multidrug resistance efflux pump